MQISTFKILLTFIFSTILFLSCESNNPDDQLTYTILDREELLSDLQFLSSDHLEGRKTGEHGNRMAQVFIEDRFQSLEITMIGDSYRHPFDHTNQRTGEVFTDAVNLIGVIEGNQHTDRYIVITAHYDHLGVIDGEIHNGADDNASGTGGLLAAAKYFSENRPENNLLFIAFDAEEQGLGGARYFVENPAIPLNQIVLNVNMDMISNNFDNEIYAVGTAHYPYLKPLIEEGTSEAPITVSYGYDTDEWPQNWTFASDHGPFHQKGIPFIYFGVVDHPHYHQPTDTFDNTNPYFYVNAVETIIKIINTIDQQLDTVVSESDRYQ